MHSFFILGVIALALIYVFYTIKTDKKAPSKQFNFESRFAVIVKRLNAILFNNKAKLVALAPNKYILYRDGESQRINFNFQQGTLLVTWSYQLFQQNCSHTEEFEFPLESTIFKQEKWANELADKLAYLRQEFKYSVLLQQT